MSRYWERKEIVLGRQKVLVERVKYHGRDFWTIEAWLPAPLGTGTYFDGERWWIRPYEETAKRAIHTAFPEARGEWTGTELREPIDGAKR